MSDLCNELDLPPECNEYEIAAHVRQLRASGTGDRDQLRRIEAELMKMRQDRDELQKQMAVAERQRQNAAFLYRQLQLEIKRRNQRMRRDGSHRQKPTIARRDHTNAPTRAGERTSVSGNKPTLPQIGGARNRPATSRNARLSEVTLSLAGNMQVTRQRIEDRIKIAFDSRGGEGGSAITQETSMVRELSMMRETTMVENTSRRNPMREPDVLQLRYCIACRQTFKEAEQEDDDDHDNTCRIHYMPMRYNPRSKCDTYECCGDGTAWSSGCLRMRHIYVQIINEDTYVISNGISQIHNSRDRLS